MNRLGHATAATAMIYQHASADRDRELARRLSAFVTGQASAAPVHRALLLVAGDSAG
jgi:hypothetical protein